MLLPVLMAEDTVAPFTPVHTCWTSVNYPMPTHLCKMAPAATLMRCMSLVTTVTNLLRCPTEVLRRLRRSQRETSWGGGGDVGNEGLGGEAAISSEFTHGMVGGSR